MKHIMENTTVWSAPKARAWYDAQPWPCGFNYIPAYAISYTEMWMEYAFDADAIDAELRLARNIGFNCARVVLPFIVWENEPAAFKARLDTFLKVSAKNGIKVMFSLFDDCGFGDQVNPVFGKQPPVIPGWYANGWTPSPGHNIVRDNTQWPRLEPYVKDVVGSFKNDTRVWVWDVYNEPTNGVSIGDFSQKLGDITLPLLEKVFAWARSAAPVQPLTVGVWDDNAKLNEIAFENSDIITFHCYSSPEELQRQITELKKHDRPMICTEWMSRGYGSKVAGCLPVFKREKVGAMHWGLVNGKTQTHLGWRHLPGQPVSDIWQHDLYRGDHTPYDKEEIRIFTDTILS